MCEKNNLINEYIDLTKAGKAFFISTPLTDEVSVASVSKKVTFFKSNNWLTGYVLSINEAWVSIICENIHEVPFATLDTESQAKALEMLRNGKVIESNPKEHYSLKVAVPSICSLSKGAIIKNIKPTFFSAENEGIYDIVQVLEWFGDFSSRDFISQEDYSVIEVLYSNGFNYLEIHLSF